MKIKIKKQSISKNLPLSSLSTYPQKNIKHHNYVPVHYSFIEKCRPTTTKMPIQKPLVRHPGDPMALEKLRQCEVHMQPPKRPNCCKTWLSKFPTRQVVHKLDPTDFVEFSFALDLISFELSSIAVGLGWFLLCCFAI